MYYKKINQSKAENTTMIRNCILFKKRENYLFKSLYDLDYEWEKIII